MRVAVVPLHTAITWLQEKRGTIQTTIYLVGSRAAAELLMDGGSLTHTFWPYFLGKPRETQGNPGKTQGNPGKTIFLCQVNLPKGMVLGHGLQLSKQSQCVTKISKGCGLPAVRPSCWRAQLGCFLFFFFSQSSWIKWLTCVCNFSFVGKHDDSETTYYIVAFQSLYLVASKEPTPG